MTGGQTTFQLGTGGDGDDSSQAEAHTPHRLPQNRPQLKVIRASEAELDAHRDSLDDIARAAGGRVLWRELGVDGGDAG